MRFFLLFVGLSVLLVIGFMLLDEDERILGGNYYYLPSDDAMDIGYSTKGGAIYSSSEINVFQHIFIGEGVIECKANDKYILAVQQLEEDTLKPSKKRYYIIYKKNGDIEGPLGKNEFLAKRKVLEIDENLKLNNSPAYLKHIKYFVLFLFSLVSFLFLARYTKTKTKKTHQ